MSFTIQMADRFGDFLANGEEANIFRACEVEPKLALGQSVTFDLSGVRNMTESFAFCLFSNLVSGRSEYLQRIRFTGCSPLIQGFIVAALQDGLSRQTS